MDIRLDEEEHVGSDEDVARTENEDRPKKPTDKELLKALIEDRDDEKIDEDIEIKNDEDKIIVKTNKSKGKLD